MHSTAHDAPLHARLTGLALALATLIASAVGAHAAPTLGFVEHWTGATLHDWGGGAVTTNPGAGGFNGASDGYLRFSTPNGVQHKLGARSFGLEYQGNWQAAGITQVRLWLNDVGVDDPLEMHFSIGAEQSNFWQYNIAFLPPNGQWAEYVVDLSSAANWTHHIGIGTFDQALQGVTNIHVRHDHAPFERVPDDIDADVGIDRVLLTNGVVGVEPGGPSVANPVRLDAPYPNPSRGPVAFSLEVYDGGAVTLEIVDAAGRRVRRAELAAGGAISRVWTWDGRDDAGRAMPAGYYRVRATSPSGGMSRGLVRID
jgi:flagellar hook capping protein FlgD